MVCMDVPATGAVVLLMVLLLLMLMLVHTFGSSEATATGPSTSPNSSVICTMSKQPRARGSAGSFSREAAAGGCLHTPGHCPRAPLGVTWICWRDPDPALASWCWPGRGEFLV
jgi:hypothetical protein